MSLPPSLLRVKRKRTDEPVDSLYLESKRLNLDQGYVFRRVHELPNPSIREDVRPPPAPADASTNSSLRHATHTVVDRLQSERSGEAAATPEVLPPADPSSEPRRFRLARSSKTPNRVAKRGRAHPNRDANQVIIVEESRRTNPKPSQLKDASIDSHTTRRKKPGAGARLGTRPEGWTRHVSCGPGIELQAAMERFAADEIAKEHAGKLAQDCMDVAEQPQLQTAGDTMDINDDDEYVFDTYARFQASGRPVASSSAMDTFAASGVCGTYGFLVLDEDEQDFWENIEGDGLDSDDPGWDSEQDDENAENYYGNDYPEDEVDPEDEHDGDAYRFRGPAASDDEEYDSNSDVWSDAGEEDHRVWESRSWQHIENMGADQ